jgi:hypothetical protein
MRASILISLSLLLLGCSFDPNIPNARVLCRSSVECPRGYTCEPVMEAAFDRINLCCRQPGCSRGLTAEELRRIAQAAMGRNPDGGSGVLLTCGNGKVDTGETCDPPQSCPTTCPAIGCTKRRLEGSAASCTARCVDDSPQSACVSGDGCCPSTCTEETDRDCACTCGNGIKEEACGETCDPREDCPTTCAPEGCNLRRVVNPGTCMAACVQDGLQTACLTGDGCCPAGCNAANDEDCKAACGNGAIEPGERCDPQEACPTSCPAVGCTLQKLEGSASTCSARCADAGTQKECLTGDRCCPPGCTAATDQDCQCTCGDNLVQESCGETCDPVGSCPNACPPKGCQLRRLVNGGSCQAVCVADGEQTACLAGDGCCPVGCNANNDSDCTPRCGNGVKEEAELCDPMSSCPSSCPWMGCNRRKLEGEANRCAAQCLDDGVQTTCADGDGCCPMACNAGNDNDCKARCGNGVREGNEVCDGDCPPSCPAVGCQRRKLEGAAGTCNARCVDDGQITACTSGDGCCASGCTSVNDADCRCQCGNGVVESACGEKCEGAGCPTSCPPMGCNLFTLQGAGCLAECVRSGSQTMCKNADGCCPTGCTSRNDADCPPRCGNAVVEAGEQCDPITACQMAFDACTSDANTIRTRAGQVDKCTFRCQTMPRACSATADSFCPSACAPCLAACAANQDIDCRLANGAVCTHPNQCRTSCTDGRCCAQGCAVCQACTGSGGSCVPIAALVEDNVPAGACGGNSSCDGSSAGAAACKLDNLRPCTAAGQCASGACTQFFRDGDGDGQVGSTGSRFCGTTPPAGFQAMAGPDCCDTDPAVHPGQSPLMFFAMPNACGNFDYDCAGGEQKRFTTNQKCDLVSCLSGWEPTAAGIPQCGQTGTFTECVGHNVGGGFFCDIGSSAARVQSCR